MTKTFELIAHRGRNKHAMENSFEGIEEIQKINKDIRIEIDINVTKDNIPILFHDVTLSRLFDINTTIFAHTYDELSELVGDFHIPTLEEILKIYPEQKFLLDLRTDLHSNFFEGSTITPDDIKFDNAAKLFNALSNVVNEKNTKNCRVLVADLVQKARFEKLFPNCELDLPERLAREELQNFRLSNDASFLGLAPKRVYMSFSRITIELVRKFQKKGISVFLCSSLGKNKEAALRKAMDFDTDGIVTSSICPSDIALIKDWLEKNNSETELFV